MPHATHAILRSDPTARNKTPAQRLFDRGAGRKPRPRHGVAAAGRRREPRRCVRHHAADRGGARRPPPNLGLADRVRRRSRQGRRCPARAACTLRRKASGDCAAGRCSATRRRPPRPPRAARRSTMRQGAAAATAAERTIASLLAGSAGARLHAREMRERARVDEARGGWSAPRAPTASRPPRGGGRGGRGGRGGGHAARRRAAAADAAARVRPCRRPMTAPETPAARRAADAEAEAIRARARARRTASRPNGAADSPLLGRARATTRPADVHGAGGAARPRAQASSRCRALERYARAAEAAAEDPPAARGAAAARRRAAAASIHGAMRAAQAISCVRKSLLSLAPNAGLLSLLYGRLI